MRRRLAYVTLGAMVVVVAVVAAALSSQFLNQSAIQPSTVIWRDLLGNPISSITLTYTASGVNSKTVSFTCNPSLDSVTLRLSSGLQQVTVSPTNFLSCNSTPNVVTLSVSSPVSGTTTGELRAFESISSETFAAVSGTLNIEVMGP